MNEDTSGAGAYADGRQSEAALEIARGTLRLLRSLGLAGVTEVSLANGRRADIAALDEKAVIWIIEIKSSLEDFRADQKWPQYREFCDRLFFAVAPGFPREVLPEDAGLIIADRYGGAVLREAPETPLAPARRKAMLVKLARAAAHRIHAAIDPDFIAPE